MVHSSSVLRKENFPLFSKLRVQEKQKKKAAIEQQDETSDYSVKKTGLSSEYHDVQKDVDTLPFRFVDVSKLKVVMIDKNTIRDASRFKMTK